MPVFNEGQGQVQGLIQGQTPLQAQFGFQAGFPTNLQAFYQPSFPQQYYLPQRIAYVAPPPPGVCDFSDVSNYHARHPYLQWLVSTLPPLSIPDDMTNRDLVFYLFTHGVNLPVLAQALTLMGSLASAACVRSHI